MLNTVKKSFMVVWSFVDATNKSLCYKFRNLKVHIKAVLFLQTGFILKMQENAAVRHLF